MRTEPAKRLLSALLAALSVTAAAAAGAQGWQDDWLLDQEMAVLERPVWRPVILPFGDFEQGRRRGAPGWIYKQQPPGAQQDFRTISPGVPVLPGNGVPGAGGSGSGGTPGAGGAPGMAGGPGTPAGDGSMGGSGGPGDGGTTPPKPTLPTPDIDPGGPEIPMDMPPLFPPLI